MGCAVNYTILRREYPKALRYRKRIIGLPVGPRQDYERSWVLLRDGRPIGYYKTEAEARAASPEDEDIDDILRESAVDEIIKKADEIFDADSLDDEVR
jgi:hypothetical protein